MLTHSASITSPTLCQLMTCDQGAPLFTKLSSQGRLEGAQNGAWWQGLITLPSGWQLQDLAAKLRLELPPNASFALKPKGFIPQAIFSDVDATLIPAESLELLAAGRSFAPKIAELTQEAMEGRLDFASALHTRMAFFAGLPLCEVEALAASIEPYPGVRDLCRWCQDQGLPFYLVSGGFNVMLSLWAQSWGATAYCGNTLEVVGTKLTGKVCAPLIDGPGKRQWLLETCSRLQIDPAQVLAMGDGANDLAMLQAAGLRVGFHAKSLLLPHLHVLNQSGSHTFLLDFLRWKI